MSATKLPRRKLIVEALEARVYCAADLGFALPTLPAEPFAYVPPVVQHKSRSATQASQESVATLEEVLNSRVANRESTGVPHDDIFSALGAEE